MDLFNLEKIKQRYFSNLPVVIVFIVTPKNDQLFRQFNSSQTRSNCLNLQKQRFRLDTRENFLSKYKEALQQVA